MRIVKVNSRTVQKTFRVMRKKRIAQIPASWSRDTSSDTITQRTFEFKLITPMFGGGTESWILDLHAPLRAQSVKGQLRFWWRTMQTEKDHRKLLYEENSLWGGKCGTEERVKSLVSIAINNQKNVNKVEAEMENDYACDGSIVPKYVIFPITDKVKDGAKINFVTQLTFTLQVSFPKDQEKVVVDTLKLWCLFGGVGARTRRGTGSLYCSELMADFESAETISAFLKQWKLGDVSHCAPYPQLNGSIFATQKGSSNDAADVWRSFLESYGEYRQEPGVGRSKGDGRKPGRSYWPEPDAIRNITGKSTLRHSKPVNSESWFPRAAFGLPIITRFKDAEDPPESELKPENGTRWPSPLILKVIKLNNGDVLKVALVLNHAPPEKIELSYDKSHILTHNERPLNHTKERVIKSATSNPQILKDGKTPYEHLIEHLNLKTT